MRLAKRHHYIPRFYLHGFCPGDYIWVFDLRTGTTREQKIEDTAVINDLYTIVNSKGEKSDSIEKLYSIIEGPASTAIAKLPTREPLDDDNLTWLALFAALMFLRVPTRMESVTKGVEKRAREIALETFGERIFDDIELGPNRDFFTIVISKEVLPLARELIARHWTFAEAPKGQHFLTCDNPLVLHGPTRGVYTKTSISTPNIKRILPLTNRYCLMISDNAAAPTKWKMNLPYLRYLNQTLAQNAARFIFGESKEHLQAVVRQVNRAKDRTPKPSPLQSD